MIDRRIAERRAKVREHGARRRLKWLLAFVLVAAGAGAVLWLLYSPLLAVKSITVVGSARSNPVAVLEELEVREGRPMISIDEEAIRLRLVADPWIASAEVRATWPGSLEVTVLEHRPIAWIRGEDGWLLASASGAVVAAAETPPAGAARIDLGPLPGSVGSPLASEQARGALAFLGALPSGLADGAEITVADGALEAVVAGFPVRLGRPVEMLEKAAALVALIDEGSLVAGSRIELVSPVRPAVLPPNPEGQLEGEDQGLQESQPTG